MNNLNKYDVASIAAMNGLENDFQKVSAKTQRELFGCAVFGRKSIHFDPTGNFGQGEVRVSYWTDFCSSSTIHLSYEEFAAHCNNQQKIG